ncbi:unnamed protein product, partial [Rotaria sordida]
MKIPILDDDTFISQLNKPNSDVNGLLMMRDATVIDDVKLDEQLISQRNIEETWEELVVAGPITVNYIGNLMVLSSKKDFAFTSPTDNYVY